MVLETLGGKVDHTGLNENTNGLIIQYLPKGTDFASVTNENLHVIMHKLNNRPRKSLGYATPNEVFRYERKKVNIVYITTNLDRYKNHGIINE